MRLSFSKEEIRRAAVELRNAGMGFRTEPVSAERLSLLSEDVYPVVNARNSLTPQPEDFVEQVFRLLSATIVAGGTWRATDFSDETMLQRSLTKLDGKPVYKDHQTNIDNWVGLVRAPYWQQTFTDAKGNAIPAGINGTVAIDGKTSPKTARGILMGAIFSDSVTVEFDWVPSHDTENPYDFDALVGTYGPDGKMITRKCIEIIDYHELSLVWLGADPYAKRVLADGSLQNPEFAAAYSKDDTAAATAFGKELAEKGRYTVDLASPQAVFNFAKGQETTPPIVKSNKSIPMELLVALRKKLNLAADAEVTAEMLDQLVPAADLTAIAASRDRFKQAFGQVSKAKLISDVAAEGVEAFTVVEAAEASGEAAATEEAIIPAEGLTEDVVMMDSVTFENLTANLNDAVDKHLKLVEAVKPLLELAEGEEVTPEVLSAGKLKGASDAVRLQKEVAELTVERDGLKATAALGTQWLENQRAEVIRLASVKTPANEAFKSLVAKATKEELDGLLKQHGGEAVAKFGGRCKKCGSGEFEFKSSLGTGLGGSDPAPANQNGKALSFEEIRLKYDTASMNLTHQQ